VTPPVAGPPPPSLLHALESVVDRLDFQTLFPVAQPVEVELGSGDGSFLVQYARLHPERNFLGIERLLGRIRKLDRKGRRAGLANLKGLRIEAAYCLEYLLPAHAAVVVHVYFPDPWPKRRHQARRLVNERFPRLVRGVLAPGGRVYLRTDDPEYFAQMQAVFAADPAFSGVATPLELEACQTDFERDFRAQGKPIFGAACQLASPAS
jgi:tRNA (guanine-N7-)-methyltransferase